MDTMSWKILLAILIFVDANLAYFEIRRLIQNSQNRHQQKTTNLPDNGGAAARTTDFTI